MRTIIWLLGNRVIALLAAKWGLSFVASDKTIALMIMIVLIFTIFLDIKAVLNKP